MNIRFFIPSARMILAPCLALAFGTSIAASRVELQGGRSYMDRASATTVFVEGTLSEHVIGSSRFSWTRDFSLGWIDGRNMPRYRLAKYATTDAIWLVAAGARLRYGNESDWYHSLFLSFQPAIHTGKTQALSSTYEFVSTLGWQARVFSVQIRHISNGSMHQPNRGETMALLGVRLPL
ncbi:MAG: acyloxyacyl hydrolase [Rhodanobacter sp.]